jgi:glutamyl-tRNA synthetase
LLGYEAPEYLHVPLVVNHDGVRLSKRDSALAGPALWDAHGGAEGLLAQMGQSLGLAAPGEKPTLAALVNRFDQGALSAEAWIV